MRAYTRERLMELTPALYLSQGFRDGDGRQRPGLVGEFATAAANQLLSAELAPQELAFTAQALSMLLPLQSGTPQQRIGGALAEALETVARMLKQPNNEGLVQWLQDCAAHVGQDEDVDAMQQHVMAVFRQYGLIVSFVAPEPSSSPPLAQ